MRPSAASSCAELERGASAHFADPTYYDSAYRKRTADIGYYVRLAQQFRRPVLEYGCGNGRIALPMARAGVAVTGIDRSAPMVRDLRRRLRDEPVEVRQRLSVRQGDMRTLRLGKRFGLVLCTFNTLLHLYTRKDLERFLARVRCHLRPTGRFVFDVTIPDPEELSRDPARAYHWPRFRHPTTKELVRYSERFDYDPLRQTLNVIMRFEPQDRPAQAWTTPLIHRQFFPQELEALLHYNGLRIEALRGDWTSRAPDHGTETLVYHCGLRRGFTPR